MRRLVDAEIMGLSLNLEDEPVVDLWFGKYGDDGKRTGMAMNMPLSIVRVGGKPVDNIDDLRLRQKCQAAVRLSERKCYLENYLWVWLGGCETVFRVDRLKTA